MTEPCQHCWTNLEPDDVYGGTGLCPGCQSRRGGAGSGVAERTASEARSGQSASSAMWQLARQADPWDAELGAHRAADSGRDLREFEAERRQRLAEREQVMARQRAFAVAAPQLRGSAAVHHPDAVGAEVLLQRSSYRRHWG